MAPRLCSGSNSNDFVFDTYVEGSVKDSERARRSCCKPIDLHVVAAETHLPVPMDVFWVSPTNKVKLQQLLRETILQQTYQRTVVVNTIGVGPEMMSCMSSIQDIGPISELNVDLEEADVKLIPHALHAVKYGSTRIVCYLMILMSWYWHCTTGTF